MKNHNWNFFWIQTNLEEPIVWNPGHPFWAEDSHNEELRYDVFTYIPKGEKVKKYWPDSDIIKVNPCKKIEFTEEFPMPDWYKELESKKEISAKRKMKLFFRSFIRINR